MYYHKEKQCIQSHSETMCTIIEKRNNIYYHTVKQLFHSATMCYHIW